MVEIDPLRCDTQQRGEQPLVADGDVAQSDCAMPSVERMAWISSDGVRLAARMSSSALISGVGVIDFSARENIPPPGEISALS